MMYMYPNNVRLARKIAIGTIISGLIFLGAYYFTYDISYVYGGVFFGLGVAAIVVTILVSGLIASTRQNHNPKEKGNTILWNLLSLASIILFTIIGLTLTNTSKIVVKNNLNDDIKNLFITGCQNYEIGEISANSCKTIHVNYLKNEQDHCEIGIRYTTSSSIEDEILIVEAKPFKGEKIVYEIN